MVRSLLVTLKGIRFTLQWQISPLSDTGFKSPFYVYIQYDSLPFFYKVAAFSKSVIITLFLYRLFCLLDTRDLSEKVRVCPLELL